MDEEFEPDALLERLRVIEEQPLETRAEALARVHDELRRELDSGDRGDRGLGDALRSGAQEGRGERP